MTCEDAEMIEEFGLDDLPILSCTGNNYAVFPDFTNDSIAVVNEISEKLQALSQQSETDGGAILISATTIPLEEVSQLVLEMILGWTMDDGFELGENWHISIVGDNSADSWESLSSWIDYRLALKFDNADLIALPSINAINVR